MTATALVLLFAPAAILAYAVVLYPAILMVAAHLSRQRRGIREPEREWPLPYLTITVPAYNEEGAIRTTLDRLLALEYPAELRQILVISDASTDATDSIVREYAGRGVELLRLPRRSGKSAAENAAAQVAHGEIIVNIDASVRVEPGALLPLVMAFRDPTVGVASGRDVSVGDEEVEGNRGEGGYVGYEMWLRGLETEVHSIVGASGCFFATRRELFDSEFPAELSRDFASALMARRRGFRAVSVSDALCTVPRTKSLRAEYSRKVRTMARGLATLFYMRDLMNPGRYGAFAWMLISHKLCRWIFYLTLPLAVVGVLLLARAHPAGVVALAGLVALLLAGVLTYFRPEGRKLPRGVALAGYLVLSNVAGVVAWWRYFEGETMATWEPTRRPG